MARIGTNPGDNDSAPIESRRSTVPEADPSSVASAETGSESPIDLPDLGEFSSESARMSPLDEIAEAEREKAPRD